MGEARRQSETHGAPQQAAIQHMAPLSKRDKAAIQHVASLSKLEPSFVWSKGGAREGAAAAGADHAGCGLLVPDPTSDPARAIPYI